jgi:hypothetical protein
MSPSDATPRVSEATTSGITIIVIARMNAFPTKLRKGRMPAVHASVAAKPLTLATTPTTAPRTRPMVILV